MENVPLLLREGRMDFPETRHIHKDTRIQLNAYTEGGHKVWTGYLKTLEALANEARSDY